MSAHAQFFLVSEGASLDSDARAPPCVSTGVITVQVLHKPWDGFLLPSHEYCAVILLMTSVSYSEVSNPQVSVDLADSLGVGSAFCFKLFFGFILFCFGSRIS